MSDLLGRLAPAGVAAAGAALVALGGQEWAADVPVVRAVGWAVAAAGLLAWFVGAGLRRLIGVIAAVLLVLALGVTLASGGGAWMALAAIVAVTGVFCAAVVVIRSQPRRTRTAGELQVDPWTALDRGEDPTAGPSANERST